MARFHRRVTSRSFAAVFHSPELRSARHAYHHNRRHHYGQREQQSDVSHDATSFIRRSPMDRSQSVTCKNPRRITSEGFAGPLPLLAASIIR
jgi:hypothetical protein